MRIRACSFTYRHFGAFRFLLAILVLLQHYLANLAPQPLATATLPYGFGSVAVLVFFCLSGFVITEAAVEFYGTRPAAFMMNRVLRIVPHFILATLMAIAIYYWFYHTGTLRISRGNKLIANVAFGWRNIFLNLINLAPQNSKPLNGYNFIDVAWTLRLEMVFYVGMFVCLGIFRLIPGLGRLFGLGGIAFAVMMLLSPLFVMSIIGDAPHTFRSLPYFTFGSALYFAAVRRARLARVVSLVALAAAAWEFLSVSHGNPELGVKAAVVPGFIVLVVLIAGMTFLATRQFEHGRKIDRRFGDLTYPLYLYHQNIMIIALSVTSGYSYGVLVEAIAASLLFVYGVHTTVDPAIENIRNRVRGRDLRRTPSSIEDGLKFAGAHPPSIAEG